MAFDRRIHRSVVGIRHLGNGEPERPQRCSNECDVVVRVFERTYLRVVGLIADQQRDACFRPRMRRHQSNQKNNDRGPQMCSAP
jgi:hypothetical protein